MSDRRLKHDDVRSTVETRCPSGHPQVLRCYPLRTGSGRFEPFPTLFWLVCPALRAALSRLEHEGWIRRLGQRLRDDAAFLASVESDHASYATERWSLLSAPDRDEIRRRGLEGELTKTGIGGIRDWATVKCLHLHYAHHLARGSAIGRALEAVGALRPCAAAP